jgi:hypothetical protein
VTPSGVSSNALTSTLQTGLSLEDLKLTFESNLYWPGQDLFNWGVTWKKRKRYAGLDELRKDLSVDQEGAVVPFHVQDYSALDLRVPLDSPTIKMDCYPHGSVPDILLGTIP